MMSLFIGPDPSAHRMGLSVEKKLAITPHYLRDTESITVTTNSFGVSRSTESPTIRTLCISINTYLGPRYLRVPTGDSLNSTVNSLEGKNWLLSVADCQSYFCFKMKYTLMYKVYVIPWEDLLTYRHQLTRKDP